MKRLLDAMVFSQLHNLLATAALAAIGAGFWMAWEPLGLIVPGAIVFGCMAWSRTRSD